ncbi:hypothetical protein ACFWPV_15890 [Streptomyces uncialis]|uniref:hypothetical protein n=1 Tax=Streptomyces uncialis TaxID=1048205 RepID=UPI0036544115
MGDAIGQMLPSALGIAISPLPLIAIVLARAVTVTVHASAITDTATIVLREESVKPVVGALQASVEAGADLHNGPQRVVGEEVLDPPVEERAPQDATGLDRLSNRAKS